MTDAALLRFWQEVYLAATRAGHNHDHATIRADNAVQAYLSAIVAH